MTLNWVGTPGLGSVGISGPLPYVDVRGAPYNATGNGTTDDTTALQAAATAAAGGDLLLPAGTYGITAHILIGSHTRVRGAGKQATTIKALAGFSGTGLIGAAAGATTTNVVIEDMTIDGSSLLGANAAAIHFAGGGGSHTQTHLRHLRVIGVSGDSAWATNIENSVDAYIEGVISDTSGAINLRTGAVRPYIVGCVVLNTGNAGIVVATGSFGRIIGNTVDTVASGHNAIDVAPTSTHMVVAGNTLTGANANLYIEDVTDVTVIGNVLKTGRISLARNAGDVGKCVIVGNTVDATTEASIELALTGSGTPYYVISGNLVRSSQKESIKVTAGATARGVISNNLLLDGGQATNNTYDGIALVGAQYTTVHGNVLVDTAANKSRYGVNETSAADNNDIALNTFVNQVTGGVNAIGASTKVRLNKGHITENSGTGSIVSGATTAVVTHGLSVTPTLDDISIVFGEQGTADYGRWWVGTITSTQFTLNVSVDPGVSNLDFAWRAVVL